MEIDDIRFLVDVDDKAKEEDKKEQGMRLKKRRS